MSGISFLIFFCATFFRVSFLSAQTCDFISYGVEEGLSQSEVQCIYQDSRGYMWVGTTGGGVCSFDGTTFKEYGKKNGLAGQVVNCIAEDSLSDLWFGTQLGASMYDGKTFFNFNNQQLGYDEILSMVKHGNKMWIAGTGGICEYDCNKKTIHRILTGKRVRYMCADENGTIWAGSEKTLFRFSGYRCDSVDLKLPAGYSGSIYSLCSDKHGLIYIGLSDGMLIYRPSSSTVSRNGLADLLNGKTVHYIYCDHNGTMWASTLNNLVVSLARDGTFKTFESSNGLTAEGIFMIVEDNSHHMWFATREQSLLKLRSETFTYYGNLPGMESGTVFRIYEDHSGRIWVGSNQDGVYCYDGKNSVAVLNNGKQFKQPVTCAEDHDKRIWIGHYDGLSCVENGHVTKTILEGIRVRSVYCDRDGNLWIGTWGKGLYVYDGKNLVPHNMETKELPNDYVHTFCQDKNGIMWIGTGGGLCRTDGKTFRSYGAGDGLCNAYVGSLVEDPWGNIWFHTDECIMRFDGNVFTSYTDENGLASNTFYLLAFDNDSNLWVGTNKGIDRVKVDAAGKFHSVKNYSRNEGFRGIECNSRAVCVSKDGCLWFGTVKGVIKYNPSKEEKENIQPIVHLGAIRLFLETTDWGWTGVEEKGFYHLPDKLSLSYEQNHLTFLYQAVNLQNPQSTKYIFMLTGFDSTWQPVTTATEITYANLPPGNYTFHVKAANNGTGWNVPEAVSCPIIILPAPPPFYARWWFILFALALTGGSLYYISVGRNRRIVHQKELLEHEVHERTLEISKQNEEKTLMLKEIHHRVKNNLQVISSLLNLQAEGISDKHVLALFEDLRHRVNSMALIHEKMYQSKNLVNIDIGNYIDELIGSLIDAYDSNKAIHLKTDIEDHPFRIDTIVPLGLILNEIISNSLKYAFADKNEGNLFVSLHKKETNKFLLIVSDDGKGIPDGINFKTADSLGMQLINMLSGQINAKVELDNEKGTKYIIEFSENVKDRF